MNEQEAVKWYKRGVTPGWLENVLRVTRQAVDQWPHKFPEDKTWSVVAAEIEARTDVFMSPSLANYLADYWGIE